MDDPERYGDSETNEDGEGDNLYDGENNRKLDIQEKNHKPRIITA